MKARFGSNNEEKEVLFKERAHQKLELFPEHSDFGVELVPLSLEPSKVLLPVGHDQVQLLDLLYEVLTKALRVGRRARAHGRRSRELSHRSSHFLGEVMKLPNK